MFQEAPRRKAAADLKTMPLDTALGGVFAAWWTSATGAARAVTHGFRPCGEPWHFPGAGGPAPSTFCRSFAHGVALAFITEQASTFKAAPQHSTKAPATPARGAKRPGGPPWFMGVLGPPWGHRRGSRHQPVASLGTVEGRRVHRRRVIGADCGVGTPAIGSDAGWPRSSLVAQPAGT